MRIQLCGRVVIELEGRRLERGLPGRQGRLLFVYLAANRLRTIGRDELVAAVWPHEAPPAADSALSALLSKLRRTLGPERLEGRGQVRLVLPADANGAQALFVYDKLRCLLRDELGIAPGPETQELYRRLLA